MSMNEASQATSSIDSTSAEVRDRLVEAFTV